jgi:putative salt-induced outer membrane protein YdiY
MFPLLLLFASGADAAVPTAPNEFRPLSLTEVLAQPAATQPVQEEEGPPQGWTGSVTAGATITDGNSESRGGNATGNAELRREDDRIEFGFLWLFAENANNATDTWLITDRRTNGWVQYDYFFSKKTFAFAKALLENDLQMSLDLRQTYSAGLGRQIKETEEFKLAGELGVAWVDQDFKTDADDVEYLAARAAYNVDWIISKVWSFGQNGEIYPSLEDSDDVYAKLNTRVKAAFGESMFGQLQWLYDWNNSPATGAERVDNQFLLSIGWKF